MKYLIIKEITSTGDKTIIAETRIEKLAHKYVDLLKDKFKSTYFIFYTNVVLEDEDMLSDLNSDNNEE